MVGGLIKIASGKCSLDDLKRTLADSDNNKIAGFTKLLNDYFFAFGITVGVYLTLIYRFLLSTFHLWIKKKKKNIFWSDVSYLPTVSKPNRSYIFVIIIERCFKSFKLCVTE